MKFNLKLSTLLLIISFVGITSCSKDDDDAPSSYIGSWTTVQVVDGVSTNVNLTLTATTFKESVSMVYMSIPIQIAEASGTLKVEGNSFTETITKFGLIDYESSLFGELIYYEKGDAEFESLILQNGGSDTMTGIYSVDKNTLTITMDENFDGVINSEDETVVYTRK